MINLLANTKGFSKEYQSALSQQVALNREMNRGQAAGVRAAAGMTIAERQSRSLGEAVRSVGVLAGGAFSLLAAQNAAVNIKDTLADYQQFSTRLKFLSEDTRDYAQSMDFLTRLADEHGKSVLSLGESYVDLAALRKGDIISTQQQQELMTGLSNAQSALGASTGQLGNLMYGLGQALSQPKIQAQEFNQVVEPLPGLMQALTRAAGLQGQTYRDLVLEGKVTSSMFRDDLIKALEEYDGAAKANINNITAQENSLENLRVQTVAAFEEPIDNVYGALLDGASGSLEVLRDNAELVTEALTTLTTLGLIRGSAALTNYTIASGRKRVASLAAAQADLAEAKANVALAKSQAGVAGLYGTTTAAATKLKVAQDALTAAQARYNAVALTGTRIARGLWAAIGGIPGVVLLGTYALYEWSTSANDAADKTKTLSDEVQALQDTMNPFSQYTQTQATSALARYTGQLELATQMAEEMRARFNNPYFNTTIEEVIEAEKEVERLTQKIEALNRVLAKGKTGNDSVSPDDSGDTEKQTEQAEKLLQSLLQQETLYGDVSEAARVRYEVEQGALANIDESLKRQLINAALSLDATKKDIDGKRQLQDEVSKLLAKQHEELTLYGDTSREAQVRYDIEYGALKDINEALKQKLILQARDLDNQQQQKTLKNRVEQIAAAQMNPTQRENAQYQDNLSTLNQYRDSLPTTDLTQRQQVNQLIEAEHLRHNQAMEEISRTSQSQIDAMWSETFDRFAAGVGQATATALFESESLGDGVHSVLSSVGKQVVATLVEIGVKEAGIWLARQAFRTADESQKKAIETSSQATSVATGTATAAALATVWAPVASLVSLATAGGNAVGANAGIASTFALTEGLSFAGLFDNGGRIPAGAFGIAGERGPEFVRGPAYVTSRRDTARMLGGSAANDGPTQITLIDNSKWEVSGGDTDSVIAQMRPLLQQHQKDTLAQVGKQLRTGKGVVYDGYRMAR